MGYVYEGLKPANLWKNFASMNQIPRPSKHEDKIQAFAKKFGENLGLETIIDEVGNIIIRKPATPGMENRMGLILQGHLDMVPQKNSDINHDFLNDPIKTYVEDGWVKAKGTTLGADNAIGVAAAMAVLEANDIAHGPIEVLMTSDEETGMTGANNLKAGILKGDILMNLDSEDEGELYIGCAGGVNTKVVFNYTEENVPAGMSAYKISVTGLKGGHSGLDINLGRGNANKIINRLMLNASERSGLRLASIDGGNMRNAIPREAFAVVVVPESEKKEFISFVDEYFVFAKNELKDSDPGLKVVIEQVGLPGSLIDAETQANLFEAVNTCPNGVYAMSKDMPDLVETSSNLAIIKSENGKIEIASLQRSAVDSEKRKVAQEFYDAFTKVGGTAAFSGEYPGWKPNVNSPILKAMKEGYNAKFGKIPEVKVIHAGLECGILGSKYPNWDMISFGPTIRNPHSPDEMVNIKTVELFWEFLLETLKNAPIR
ncbi:MAG: aminoacyl-histidine dipeptidase [Bacteroidetes bacterium]|nr:aminoacyl-histidine dipeptidase [Bacteroidota bacterium]